MDSVTHGLVPYSIAAVLKRSRHECAAVLLGAIAPDLDVVLTPFALVFQERILLHRGITHSLFFGFFTAAILLYVFSRPKVAGYFKKVLYSDVGLEFSPRLLGFAYFGILFHVFFDSLTSRGIPLLYPLTAKRFSAELFFYLDFYLMALSAVIFAYLFFRRTKIVDMRTMGKGLLVVYLIAFLLVGGLRLYEKNIAYQEFGSAKLYATQSPFLWSVVETGDTIKMFSYDTLNRNITFAQTVNRFNINGEGASFPFEQALARAEGLRSVKEFELNARAVSVDAYFDAQKREWVLKFLDPSLGSEFGGTHSMMGTTASVEAVVSENGAR